MSKHTAIIASVFLYALTLTDVCAEGHNQDSYILAINYFDSAHEVGIALGGEEHRYIGAALQTVRDSISILENVHIRVPDIHIPQFRSVSPFHVIGQTVRERGHSKDRYSVKRIESIARTTTLGCRKTSKTVETEYPSGSIAIEKTTIFQVFDYCRDINKHCENSDVMDWLCSFDVQQIILTTRERNRELRAGVYVTLKRRTDTNYLIRRMKEDDLYDVAFNSVELEPLHGQMIGGGNHILVRKPPTHPDFTSPINFVFVVGWGDCPSGCIWNHKWEVQTIPKGKDKYGYWRFEIADISESGADVPVDVINAAERGFVSVP